MTTLDYDRAPFLAIWETTQACDLACKHCRASAQPLAHPSQLTTREATHLIDQVADLQVPLFVFTGGDPLKRPDIFELIQHAAGKGVHAALTPSATPLLTRDAIFRMKDSGLSRLAVSLDGSTPAIHDSIRGIPGTWERTVQAIHWANEAGLPIQVHTVVSRLNISDLDRLSVLLTEKQIVMWSFFFLVPVGRGQVADLLTGQEFEDVFAKMWDLTKRVPFAIKTTEAMHYRRYLIQQRMIEGRPTTGVHDDAGARPTHPHGHTGGHPGTEMGGWASRPGTGSEAKAVGWATKRVNDGRGFVFISHIGKVYPSGFLPIEGGDLHNDTLAHIYQEAPVFVKLRDSDLLHGKCGACEFRNICGGSRARAYAVTGDVLAEEPCCIYQPRGYHPNPNQQSAPSPGCEAHDLIQLEVAHS
ncbi:MAG TPA: TIGR04053 family radical SAM/SPASM domain-containing protein [Acidobacteriaceae bacterium]|nr:TIGR04053 family radical SAM/SPASM domain-containing protein [Acidobacteriaceae bacterium]